MREYRTQNPLPIAKDKVKEVWILWMSQKHFQDK